MKRIAILLLAGATLVAAQTAADSSGKQKNWDGNRGKEVVDTAKNEKYVKPANDTASNKWNNKDSAWIAERMQKKMKDGIDKGNSRSDSAKQAARDLRKELQGKNAADSAKIIKEHNGRNQERLQNAIDALDKASTRTNAQVEDVKARTQSRLQEKKAELQQLQEKLREKKASKDSKGETVTE
jgi:hypothetical protein